MCGGQAGIKSELNETFTKRIKQMKDAKEAAVAEKGALQVQLAALERQHGERIRSLEAERDAAAANAKACHNHPAFYTFAAHSVRAI